MAFIHWFCPTWTARPTQPSAMVLKHRLTRRPTARRAPAASFNPTTSPRSFAKTLAHTKARRLQTTIARRRRTVSRRMALDHDVLGTGVAGDMDIYPEEEVVEMTVDLGGVLSAAAHSSWEGTVQASMVPPVAAWAPLGMAPRAVGVGVGVDVGVDVPMEEVSHPGDGDGSMHSESALSAVAKVLRDADDDGSALSASPSADLLPKMAVEDDVVSLVENNTAAVRLEDDELLGTWLYSQAKPRRSCRSGYYRYEPYPRLRSLRQRRRRSKAVRTEAPKPDDGSGADCVGDETLVDEECGTTPDEKVKSTAEPIAEEAADASSEAQDPAADPNAFRIPSVPSDASLNLFLQEEEEECVWMESFSDLYWERPYVPYAEYHGPAIAQLEEGIEWLSLGFEVVAPGSEKPDPYRHTLPREEEDQDEWLNEASDLYWERPFTPAVVSSPSLVQIEVGMEQLEIAPAVATPKESSKPEDPAARQSPVIPPPTVREPPSPRPVPVAPTARPSPPRGASIPRPPVLSIPIQVPPRAFHRESYYDKENWNPVDLDLEAGRTVIVPRPKRSSSLVRSVFGTLRTWAGVGQDSR